MDTIWSEKFWCPPNYGWKDYEAGSRQKDLYYAFPTAVAILAMRFFCEVVIFRPFALIVCSKNSETNHKRNVKVSKKFSESLWRLTFYLSSSIYGIFFVLWNKPYAKDSIYTLKGFPHHVVDKEEWWYYNVELGFYVSLVITQFIDTKRKDFYQMLVHHVVTILLIFLSWTCNFHRIGCLVIAIHDVGDVPLEGAKLAKYCNKQRLADLIFAIFTLVWIYTRCYLLPSRVLYYTVLIAPQVIPFFGAYYIFNALLCLLQLIHLVWTYLIIRIVSDAIRNNGMRDLRSESEDSLEDSHQD